MIDEMIICHVYNRGNNRSKTFLNDDNYQYFLEKIRLNLKPISSILCYCLLPNHFHLMVKLSSDLELKNFRLKFGSVISSYTQGVNKRYNRTGSLFQKRTKYKDIWEDGFHGIDDLRSSNNYLNHCFNYIHDNPVNAGLVAMPEDWSYSSYADYLGIRTNDLCDIELALSLGLWAV